MRERDAEFDDETRPKGEAPVYGYEATLAVCGSDDPVNAPFPALAVAMTVLHKPGREPGRNAVRALASLRRRGHPAGYLGVDRAYSSAKAEDFQLPVAALRYRPLYDYKKNQLGVQDNFQGYLLVEGTWYCPMIPSALINATADLQAKRIDAATYAARIEERRIYEARWKQRPDAEGYGRFECPADGHPRVRCDLKPKSVGKATRGKLRILVPEQFRATAPACCTQSSVTMSPTAGAKFLQALPFETAEWNHRYHGLRNSSEHYNGYVKDGTHEDLATGGRRRVHGVAAQTFFTALLCMAANVRKIRGFLEGLAARTGKLRHLPRRRKGMPVAAWMPPATQQTDDYEPDPPLRV